MPRAFLIILLLFLPAASMAAGPLDILFNASKDAGKASRVSSRQAQAEPSLAPQPSPQDRGFIEQFMAAGISESELADLAIAKSRQEQVNALARQLGSDSKAARERLQAIIQPLHLPPPTEEPDADHKTLFEQLSAATPQDFDRLYVDSQVRDKEDQISVLEMQVSSGDDAELKKFAADMLPLAREHLQRSRQLSELLKAQR